MLRPAHSPPPEETGSKDAVAAQKDRLQGARCHHGKDESGSSQERVGQGFEPAGVEWVAGGVFGDVVEPSSCVA